MNFADLDAMVDEAGHGILRFFKLHGKMAGVIIHAQVLVQPFIAGMLGAELVEETDRLSAALQKAERFGFEAQVQLPPRSATDARDVLDAPPEVLAHGFL